MSLPRLELGALSYHAAKWPLPGKLLLGCVLAGAVLAVGEWMLLSPARARLHQAQTQEGILRQQLAQQSAVAASRDVRARQLQAMQADADALLRLLPGGSEMPGLLEDIARLALANGVLVERVAPQEEQPAPLYTARPVQIGVTGAYHDLAMFMSAVEGLSRLTTVHEMDVQREGRLLRLDLLVKTYRRDQAAVGAPVRERPLPQGASFVYQGAGLRDPFQPSTLQVEHRPGRRAPAPDLERPRGPLEREALERFQMVGTLARGAQTFALLRVATDVYRLALGDYLGPDHGRVTAIHDSHIEVVELFPDKQGAWLERPRTLVLNVNS
ncbi:pilus assembly protein PilP [Pseudomonas sp. S1Bt30]|jgi:Tfp pilus assembly protein PilO|uniref:Pilus assembly protein PilP n=1 Tax=Pseudomonas quebecensis TaxID=2995174 RepID=A0ABY6QFN6_9PSED|nr:MULTISPECIES: pilus assembly protein PilP [Pseudomonas]MCX4063162.1 pilus assembly protein PilP [Pseudomonas quebecensis]UZW18150.1 pilus assembly protein PilP [Pseudomonas quebecensis]UZW24437.1 pilus assembly protein PilP [Pseudomonas quebecensis]UZW29499.1 pilus assembly protein PilP [Pseudomonas quebecensis]